MNFFLKKFLTLSLKTRLHLGFPEKFLNKKNTSYLTGIRHNINIFDLEKLWYIYKFLFYQLVHIFFKRNVFFIVGTNKNLPMALILEKLLKSYPFNVKGRSFYVSGYVDKKWIGGVFSNWKIFKEFIQFIDKSSIGETKYKFQKYLVFLKGLKNLAQKPIPDFILFLNQDKDALNEIKKTQTPLVGFINTNMDPDDFLLKFFGNNNSTQSLEFFFEFLGEAIKEGRLKEQQLFYSYFVYKLKKLLKEQELKAKEESSEIFGLKSFLTKSKSKISKSKKPYKKVKKT